MSSVVPGYEYDIFISYRHHDNRSGWVTEFVKALQEELAGTIKEPVSVYFDTNQHDGLLETHNVDKSLEGKLKCLIFIPIISQTYCDPKSFAWLHEFCAFNKRAKEDQFGRDIKLSNGNVASRILPIRIHDLDEEDKTTIENEIGGMLRAIEFIFKSLGVNRALLAHEEHPQDNLNKTFYRDQLNKVANSIKEIIAVLKGNEHTEKRKSFELDLSSTNFESTSSNDFRKKYALVATIILIFAVASFIFYFLFWRKHSFASSDKSVAVLPFVDMSSEKELDYYGDGLAEEIINSLAHVKDLKVIARTSSFQFKGKNEDLRKVGEMLGVATILEGSIREAKDQFRITAQLISAEDGVHIWSETFDRTKDNMFNVQYDIAVAVAEALKTKLIQGQNTLSSGKRNEEAYKLYQQGRYFYDRGENDDMVNAKEYFIKSLAIDSSQAIVWHYLAESEYNLPFHNLIAAKSANEKSLKLNPELGEAIVLKAQKYFVDEHKFNEAKAELEHALRVGTPSPYLYRNAAYLYLYAGKPEKAVALGRKAVELDPLQPHSFSELGLAYFFNKQYDSSILMLKRIIPLSKDYKYLHSNLCFSLLAAGKNEAARNEMQLVPDELERQFLNCYIKFAEGKRREADSMLLIVKSKFEAKKWYYSLGLIYAYRGERAEAIKFLYKANEVNDRQFILWVMSDPWLDPLRSDPRFIELMKKIGFTD